jgi:hypothetical protein
MNYSTYPYRSDIKALKKKDSEILVHGGKGKKCVEIKTINSRKIIFESPLTTSEANVIFRAAVKIGSSLTTNYHM